MKPRICIFITTLIILVSLFSLCVYGEIKDTHRIGYIEVIPGDSKLYIDETGLSLDAWDSYGVTYFFIPSYAKIASINYDRSAYKIYTADGLLLDKPIFNTVQDVMVETDDGLTPYRVGFYQSENLYTIYLAMDDVDVSTSEYKHASVSVISPDGKKLGIPDARIKGRGNTTFDMQLKKPYELKFPRDISIMNLPADSKWALLANAYDVTKICNKMVFDTSIKMGMEYVRQSNWADLYLNGKYWGNYLVCQEPDIGSSNLDIGNLQKDNACFFENPELINDGEKRGFDYDTSSLDISGGYLMRVTPDSPKSICGFYLPDKVFYNIKSPNNISYDEIDYISSFVGDINASIHRGEFPDNIDKYSFARRYLVEEIFANADAIFSSWYYYKRQGDNHLYAGPGWDYDKLYIVLGDPYYVDKESILHSYRNTDRTNSDWDAILMENPEYNDYVKQVFVDNLDVWDDLLKSGIDKYYEQAAASISMDRVRWNELQEGFEIHYDENYSLASSNIKYMKQSLYKRLCFLASKWGVSHEFYRPATSDGSLHTISFIDCTGLETVYQIVDGGSLSKNDVPGYDSERYAGWANKKINRMLNLNMPVYEDVTYTLTEEDYPYGTVF